MRDAGLGPLAAATAAARGKGRSKGWGRNYAGCWAGAPSGKGRSKWKEGKLVFASMGTLPAITRTAPNFFGGPIS